MKKILKGKLSLRGAKRRSNLGDSVGLPRPARGGTRNDRLRKFCKKIICWFKQNERTIYLEYAFIALMILLPLLKPGYILTLDMVFTPKISMPIGVENNYLLISLLHFLNYLIPSQIMMNTVP